MSLENSNIGEKSPHFITSRLLEALRGEKITIEYNDDQYDIINNGGYLWGVENKKYEGILNHVLQVSRVAYFLGTRLQERKIPGFENLDMQNVVEAALLHDIGKLYGESRENLPPAVKESIGLSADFTEMHDGVEEAVHSWLKGFGFSENVIEAITAHDFPEEVIDNPYWKLIIVADYMAGQEVMSVEDRLHDIEDRWITKKKEKGESPRISENRFLVARENIMQVVNEIFGALQTTDKAFIETEKLNDAGSVQRWETFLSKTNKKDVSRADAAVRHVRREIE